MGNLWQRDYENLKLFIVKNPSIEITSECVMLPGEVRPEFYRLFDLVRTSFVKEKFVQELENGYVLSKNWLETSGEVEKNLNLESIANSAGAKLFFNDPLDGLIQGLFDPLFNLLKNKINPTLFEQTATQVVRDDFNKYFRTGYRRWVIITLIKLLLPNGIYSVPVKDFNDNTVSGGDYNPGVHEVNVPEAVSTRVISFEHDLMCSFLAPNVIVHSTKLGCFVSLREDYYEPQWKARFPSSKQEWLSVKDIKKEFGINNLWPDILINMADDISDLVLTADYFMIARPDVAVDFREEGDWFQKQGLDPVKRHYNVLKPILGAFVVCRETVPEAALKELEVKSTDDDHKTGLEEPQVEDSVKQTTTTGKASVNPGVSAENQLDIHLIRSDFDLASLEIILNAMQRGRQDMISKSTANEHKLQLQ
jgi:hypothetical protein